MSNKKNNKNIYIMSIEAADIWSHMKRGLAINPKFCGMIPYSRELDKLRKEGLKTNINNKTKKQTSDTIINVKFKQKVKSGNEIIRNNFKRIKKYSNTLEILKTRGNVEEEIKILQDKIKRLQKRIDYLEKVKDLPEWQSDIKVNDLRKYLYINGFSIAIINKKTEETKTNNYKIYKRSSSKSRTGQVLAIKEDLYDKMIKWSRMGLTFDNVDYPSLLSYESLIASGSESIIKINPENILLVNDVEQNFNRTCNVVRTGENYLDSFEELAEIESNLFDGQSLMQYSYFPEGKSMMLLRNHFFKSAAYACDIQKFLEDYYKKICPNKDYEQWKIPTIFNTKEKPDYIFAKDVHMIVCPSSLKALKFSSVIGEDVKMWNHWKRIVIDEGCQFGICKFEKPSKHGCDEKGNILQRMSYQMVNSLPATKDDVDELVIYEKEYIERLKNEDEFFIEYLKDNVHDTNSNEMWINLYNINRNVIGTEKFRNFRSKQVSDYLKYVKGGKIRLNGDYCYLLGNPVEMLYYAVGVDILAMDYKPALTGKEIYTKLFEFGKDYVCFRNPHTSPSNILVAKNINEKQIDKYFKNLSKNIVIVNSMNFPIQRILSGADFDSDSMAIFNNSKLLELASSCSGKYNVCLNGVDCEPAEYKINHEAYAKIDNTLSKSQFIIGRVVNAGQWAMSRYWNLINNGQGNIDEAKKYLKIVDVCTVLSEISIDMAKKMYKINLEEEMEHIESKLTGKKPRFFKYVSQNENIKYNIIKYSCPMDFLEEVLKIENGNGHKNIDFKSLLVKQKVSKRDRKQTIKIIKYINEMDDQIRHVESIYVGNDEDTEKEKNILIEDIYEKYKNLISRSKVKPDTMYALLVLADSEQKHVFSRLLNVLQKTQTYVFNKAFKQK